MTKTLLLTPTLCALCLAALPAAAREGETRGEPRGTMAQRLACSPDVFRLCGDHIPNVRAIVVCLKSNKRQLNPDCRAVFEGRLK